MAATKRASSGMLEMPKTVENRELLFDGNAGNRVVSESAHPYLVLLLKAQYKASMGFKNDALHKMFCINRYNK